MSGSPKFKFEYIVDDGLESMVTVLWTCCALTKFPTWLGLVEFAEVVEARRRPVPCNDA